MKKKTRGAALLILLLSSNAFAITWGRPEERPDPVIDGATCAVSEPMSWGSYIYHWPSKYDQVFFPLTDEHAIWFCRESGFTAFIGDFELTPEEKAALVAHLPQVYHRQDDRTPDTSVLLQLLQESYGQRRVDREFRIRLLRVLAYDYDAGLQDYETAARLRKEALVLIVDALGTELEEGKRLEYLFVAAAYYREFGDVGSSDAKLAELNSALQGSTDEEVKGYVEYLSELQRDVARITPGGPLAPPPMDE
jgi:hypothetical protein